MKKAARNGGENITIIMLRFEMRFLDQTLKMLL